MKYDIKYLTIRCSLIKFFLIGVDPRILDISYSDTGNRLIIQIVSLPGYIMDVHHSEEIQNFITDYQVDLRQIFLSKDEYNQNSAEWLPKDYIWLENVLFSKAEVL